MSKDLLRTDRIYSKKPLISCLVKDLSLTQQGSRGAGEQGRGFSAFCTDAPNNN
ncbi:hypothetical protein JYQ62_05890 [Nostoc sp. UHCC 0702]|nr:hypothetical protein JYQ62_05890 [Nostoc sp. UHCC 0702]